MKQFSSLRILFTAFIFCVFSQSVNAQLLTEPFNYTVDASFGLAKQSGGQTWIPLNTGDSILINSGSLTYGSLPASTGNSIIYAGAGTDYYRAFTSQTSGTVYASFLLKVTDVSALTTTGGYTTGFIDGTATAFAGRMWIRNTSSGGTTTFNLGINAGSTAGNTVWATNTLNVNATYLITIAYQIVSGTANDVGKIWINTALGNTTEPTSDASSTNTGATDNSSIQRYFFRQDAAGTTPTMIFDELRIGTTWASVTPSSSSPTLSPTPTSLSGFTYASGSGPSASQSFTFTGAGLTGAPGNITVSGSADYEVSTDNSTFASSVTYAYSSATLATQTVYVRLISGLTVAAHNGSISLSGGGASSSVTTTGSVTASSTLTPTPSTLSGFTYTFASGGPSSSQSFTFSGANLTGAPGNITVSGSANYEVSTNNSTFNASVTYAYSSATLSSQTVYVRLKSGLAAGNYNSQTIGLSGGGATSSVTVSGNVSNPVLTATPITLSGFNYIFSSGGPSASQSFTFSGTNLTGAPDVVTVSGSANYDVSTDNSTFGASVTYNFASATLASQTVYVRLKAGLPAGIYNSQVIGISGGSTTASVTVSGSIYSGTFSPGNLAVETIGNGTAFASAYAYPISVREYNTSGSQTNSFTLPNSTSGPLPSSSPWYMTESGTQTAVGYINRSADGSFVVLPGYNTLTGSGTAPATTTTPTNKRVMGVIQSDGSISTTAYDFFSGGNFRSIASNGYSFWACGTVTGGVGLYYLKDANSTPVSLGSINTRVVKILNNKLYYATATTGGTGIYQVSTNGLPLSISDVSLTRLTDATYASTINAGSPYAFDINPAGTIMYIADDASTFATGVQKAGIIKYTNSGSGWTYAYTLPSPVTSTGARGLAVDWTTSPSTPIIYFTTSSTNNNVIAKITDVNSGSTGSIVVPAIGATYAMRGLQFSPVAISGVSLTCTANLLAFGGVPNGFASDEKVFNVAGSGYTGNITVTAPAGYEVSLTSGSGFATSLLIAGTAPTNTTIYMRMPATTSVGTYNGNLTISANASTLLVPVTGKNIIPVNYYNVTGADVTQLSNWGTNTNGSGTNPPDFNTDGQFFNISNTPLSLASAATTATLDPTAIATISTTALVFSANVSCPASPASLVVGNTITGPGLAAGTTITAINNNTITLSANATSTASGTYSVGVSALTPWTVSGTISKVIVGNGITFTIPAAKAYSGTIDVAGTGILKLQNSTIPTLGTLDPASTVNYNQTGASTVVSTDYGNLTLQGSALDSRTLPTASSLSPLIIAGNLTADNVTVTGATVSPFTFVQLGGNITMSNGAVMVSANPSSSSGLLSVTANGTGSQTISYTGGGTVHLNSLTLSKTTGSLTLTGTSNLGIFSTLNCTTGILTTGTNKVVLNSTATLTETTSSYVLGNIETTRSLTTAANNFGGLGLTISAGTAPGTTTVLRNTGTSNAVGCLAKSVKRTFTITNSGSGLNANLAYSFIPANELNNLIQTELELYNVTGNTVVPNSSISGNTISVAGLSSVAGTYTAAIATPTITASATADPVCHATGAQTTDLAYTATTGDIVSHSITWSGAAPAQGFTNVTDAPIVASPIVIAVPANAVANTYTGSLTIKNSSGCTSVSSPFTLLINPQLIPSVSIAITTGSNPTCQGGNITFTATPFNGGTAPTYQWYKNGSPVSGNTTNTYTATNINTSTPVYVVMTVGTGICVTTTTATSSTTTLTTKDNSWTGAVSTTWGTPANWCSGSVPGAATNIVIPTGLSRYPVLNNTYAVHDIEIQSGATVSLNDQQLTISGIIEGTGKFKGTPNSKLVISTPGAIGTLYMDPAANTLSSLKQTTALSTLTLGNPVGITGELNVGNTTLNTGGNLTLRSNVNGTAWVAPITGSGSITGSVTVERYMPYYGHRAWMMLAVPTGGSQTINAAWQEGAASGTSNPNPGYGTLLTKAAANPAAGYDATTAGNSLLILNTGVPNATGSWAGVTTSLLTTPVATTSGYMVYMRGDRSAPVTGGPVAQGPVTLRTSGSLYQGTQTAVPVSGSNNTLIGNIYASAVDYKNLVKTGLAGNFKLWDPKLGTIGGYQTFTDLGAGNPASYTPSPGGGSYGSTPNTRIESGQAFIVQGGGGGGSIQFTEAARVSGSNNYVFRGQGSLSQYPGFKVNLEVSTASGFVLADGNSVYYNDAYSDAVNNDDATKVPNFGENFGILKDGHVSQVETRRTMDSIVYQMTNLQQQQYRLQFIASGFETGAVSATLVDNFLHTATPVSLRDTVSILFKVTTDAGSSEANRFKVVFKNSHPVTDMSIHAAGKETTVQVVWTVNNEHNTRSYEVEHSSNGIEFKTGGMVNAIANGSPVLTYNWLDENPVNGDNYYRVKAVSKSGESNYSSMVKVTIGKDKKGFAVYPNPVTGDRANIQFINQPAGRYTVNVINKAGQVLYTTVILHNGGTATQTVALSTAVTTGTYQVEVVNAAGEKNVQNMLISK